MQHELTMNENTTISRKATYNSPSVPDGRIFAEKQTAERTQGRPNEHQADRFKSRLPACLLLKERDRPVQ